MIQLRPVVSADVETLERERIDPEAAGEFGWLGFAAPGWLRRRLDDGGLLAEHSGKLAIDTADGQLVGTVSWWSRDNGPPPNGRCWMLGIWITPEYRGRGYGSDAQRAMAEYLFTHSAYERVEASTEAGNLAEQRALAKAGFTREGVLRRACFRDGDWRDMVLFSKLRGE